MFAAAVYTVFSLLNLIGFVGGVLVLPSEVPIHFNASMTADAVGTPWVFVALPAAAALISAAIWTSSLSKRPQNKKILISILSAVGAVLACIGWVFFALISSGVRAGERASFPFVLCIVLPICFLSVFLGVLCQSAKFKGIFKRDKGSEVHRLFGRLLIAVGGVSAAVCVILSCLAKTWSALSALVLAFGIAFSFVLCLVRAKSLARREEAEKAAEDAQS